MKWDEWPDKGVHQFRPRPPKTTIHIPNTLYRLPDHTLSLKSFNSFGDVEEKVYICGEFQAARTMQYARGLSIKN